MLRSSFTLLIPLFVLSAGSVLAKPAKALVMTKSGQKQYFLVAASDQTISYQDSMRDTTQDLMKRREVESIYFSQPAEFQKALAAFGKGNYTLAATLFAQIKKDYKSLEKLKGNYSVRAAFYEIECARKTFDLEKMDRLLDDFFPETLVNETYIAQLELYPFWNALRSESWVRLMKLVEGWEKKKLPNTLKAQIYYCHAQALLAEKNESDALIELNRVIAFCAYREPALVAKSCEAALKVMLEQNATKKAFESMGKEELDQSSAEYYQLIEAATLVRLWDSIERPLVKRPKKYDSLVKLKLER